jgi:hypothetical protein
MENLEEDKDNDSYLIEVKEMEQAIDLSPDARGIQKR